MNALLQLDKSLFRLLNGRWHNSFLDALLPYVRNAVTWLPLYVFLLVFVLANFRHRWWIVLYAACTATASDMLSSSVIKQLFFRERPCHDASLTDLRFLVNYCPISSSFTSSHAANHFAIATFLYFIFRPVIGRWATAGFWWAGAIAYAQIYVGVHYPFDVLAGSLLGLLVGAGFAKLYRAHLGTEASALRLQS